MAGLGSTQRTTKVLCSLWTFVVAHLKLNIHNEVYGTSLSQYLFVLGRAGLIPKKTKQTQNKPPENSRAGFVGRDDFLSIQGEKGTGYPNK